MGAKKKKKRKKQVRTQSMKAQGTGQVKGHWIWLGWRRRQIMLLPLSPSPSHRGGLQHVLSISQSDRLPGPLPADLTIKLQLDQTHTPPLEPKEVPRWFPGCQVDVGNRKPDQLPYKGSSLSSSL